MSPADSALFDPSACVVKPDPWFEAVLDACMVAHLCVDEKNPRATIEALIDWHVAVALDPAVSAPMAKLHDALNELGISHDCYTDADADRPDSICDRNGAVVLSLCKICNRAEVELTEPCNSAPTHTPKLAAPASVASGDTPELRNTLREIILCYPWGQKPQKLVRDNTTRNWHLYDNGSSKFAYLPDWQNNLVNSAIAATVAKLSVPSATPELVASSEGMSDAKASAIVDYVYEQVGFKDRYALIADVRAILAADGCTAAPSAKPATAASSGEGEPTDLSYRLRETADQQPGWKPLLTAAADEIERYYGGMMAWKKTAKEADARANEARSLPAADADAVLLEYFNAATAFNNAHGEGSTVEIERAAEARFDAATQAAHKAVSIKTQGRVADADAAQITNEQIIGVLHSEGIDTKQSAYGFSALQVGGTSVPGIKAVVMRCLTGIRSGEWPSPIYDISGDGRVVYRAAIQAAGKGA